MKYAQARIAVFLQQEDASTAVEYAALLSIIILTTQKSTEGLGYVTAATFNSTADKLGGLHTNQASGASDTYDNSPAPDSYAASSDTSQASSDDPAADAAEIAQSETVAEEEDSSSAPGFGGVRFWLKRRR